MSHRDKKTTVLMDNDVYKRFKKVEKKHDKRSISSAMRHVLDELDAVKAELENTKRG